MRTDYKISILWLFTLRSTCRLDHPYSKYGIGNIDTLKNVPEASGIDVRDELIKFHEKYYSSNLMTLCILGRESISDLESYAVDMFSVIPNKNLPRTIFEPDPYLKTDRVKIIHAVPVQEKRELCMSWLIPDMSQFYQECPLNYLTHLVGHESEDGLLSKLKNKGWCIYLSASEKGTPQGFAFLEMSLGLTIEGNFFYIFFVQTDLKVGL